MAVAESATTDTAPLASPPPRLFVDGHRTTAADGATFDVLDPSSGRVIGTAADGGRADMDAAIAAARRAFDDGPWATDLDLRVRCLRQLHRALVDHGERLRALTTAEGGAPTSLTLGPQYDAPVAGLEWMVDLAERYPWVRDLGRAETVGGPARREVWKEPVGVVGAITPWNYPTQITLAKLGPALAAGNTVVLKPAPDTPWVASELGRLVAEETETPPGVVNVVHASDHRVGRALSGDPRVDLVSFTGSTATGRDVMATAAANVTRVFLELGGKSAAVVLDDADLASAVGLAAFSVCIHAGQGCALTTRLVVPRHRHAEAVDVAVATMQGLAPSDPTDPATICGPVISARQRDRVEEYLRLAAVEGGSFATGGGRPDDRDEGFWIDPTVVVGVDNDARVAREEIFGPVLTVLPHDGDDDAVRIANDSPYGLSGSVDSADPDRARAVASRIRTGTLSVNGGVWFAPDVPFGGYKQSGIGREMGVAGFEEYLETKLVAEPAEVEEHIG